MQTIVHHEVKAEIDKKRPKERSLKETQRKKEKKPSDDKRKDEKIVEEKEDNKKNKREPYYKPKSPAPPVDIPTKPYPSTKKSEGIKERFATSREAPEFTLFPALVSTAASFNPPTPPLTARHHQVHFPSSALPEGEERVPIDTHVSRSSLPSVSDITVRVPTAKVRMKFNIITSLILAYSASFCLNYCEFYQQLLYTWE